MKRQIAWLVIIVAIAVVMPVGCGRSRQDAGAGGVAGKKALYTCPMHPTVTSDKPGDCPICGMKLVPMAGAQESAAGGAPGLGLAPITVTPELRQRMGLKVGIVEKRALARNIRTSARIVPDETRLSRVTTKVEGWVEQLHASVTGQAVKQGEPLLTIYSPDLVSAQQEYLSALKFSREAGGNTNLVDAAKARLQFFDISDEQIQALEKSGKVEKVLTLHSPANGWILEKSVLAGQKVMPGDSLLVVADLSSVWGEADIHELDMPYVRVGMPVELTIPSWKDGTFTGKVSFVSSSLDPQTRTVTARLEIPNPDLLLKPNMFADAQLTGETGEKLALPEAAVMWTGEHSYVFHDAGDGKLVPVEIKTGIRSEGYCEVVSGLAEGDKVVTSANFLVDSESSVRAALDSMAR